MVHQAHPNNTLRSRYLEALNVVIDMLMLWIRTFLGSNDGWDLGISVGDWKVSMDHTSPKSTLCDMSGVHENATWSVTQNVQIANNVLVVSRMFQSSMWEVKVEMGPISFIEFFLCGYTVGSHG